LHRTRFNARFVPNTLYRPPCVIRGLPEQERPTRVRCIGRIVCDVLVQVDSAIPVPGTRTDYGCLDKFMSPKSCRECTGSCLLCQYRFVSPESRQAADAVVAAGQVEVHLRLGIILDYDHARTQVGVLRVVFSFAVGGDAPGSRFPVPGTDYGCLDKFMSPKSCRECTGSCLLCQYRFVSPE